jgi:Flp pilus assembly protein TadG
MRMFMERRGEGLVEFSLVLPMFLLLMFAMIDLGRYYWIRETVENAIRQAGRYAVTGQSMTNMTRVASIQQVAKNATVGLNPNNTTYTVSSAPPDSLGAFTSGSAGNPGDFVKVDITTTLGFFTPGIARYFGPNGSNTLNMSVIFRSENFLPNQGG